MPYYIAEFTYPGPWCGASGPTIESSRTLDIADIIVCYRLLKNINSAHCYYWPDGSLYRYIQSDLPLNELKDLINSRVKAKVKLNTLTLIPPEYEHVSKKKVHEIFSEQETKKI